MPRALAAVVTVFVLAVLAGCTHGKQPAAPADLPDGGALVASAAAEMRSVKTARFVITTEGTVDRLGLTGADATVTRDGDAKGTATLDQSGSVTELSFVVVGDTLHIKGPTGGWQQIPLSMAASVYDPSAILDPDRGVAKVLATASHATARGTDTVEGQQTVKVEATLDASALAAIVPGIAENVSGTLWIGKDRPLLYRASFRVPGDGGGGTVTVTLSEFDAPVSISAP